MRMQDPNTWLLSQTHQQEGGSEMEQPDGNWRLRGMLATQAEMLLVLPQWRSLRVHLHTSPCKQPLWLWLKAAWSSKSFPFPAANPFTIKTKGRSSGAKPSP